jgi:hypothetical protein
MKQRQVVAAAFLSVLTSTGWAWEAGWTSLTGKQALTSLMSGLKVERTLPNGEISRGEYRADGTGTLYSWGEALAVGGWRLARGRCTCI